MDELIEALQIFKKYMDEWGLKYPLWTRHDTLGISGVERWQPAPEERERLAVIGFFWSEEYDSYISFRFGSS